MNLHQKLFWLLILLLPVQLGRHLWPEWAYVLGLRVDYLAPTIYLTDLLVAGILVSWWWQTKSKYTLYAVRYTLQKYWWVIAIFVYLLANSLLAQNPGAALYKFVKIIEFTLLGFYVAKNQYSVSSIQYPVFLAVIYSSLIAFAQFLKQASLGGVFWWLGERTFTIATPGIARAVVGGRLLMRPYATFPHPNVLAGCLLVSLILLGNWKPETRNWKFSKWAAMALGITTIVISFSRSAWVGGLIIGLSLFVCRLGLTRKKIHNSKFIILNSLALILFLASIVGIFYFAPRLSTEEAISQRLQLVKVASLMIQSAPVSGVGLNNFIVRLPEFWTVQSIYWLQPVHNVFLLIAAEIGLVGLLIFLWVLILTFKKLLITNHYARFAGFLRNALIASLTIILFLGLLDHYWLTLQQSQLLFSLIIGLSWKQ